MINFIKFKIISSIINSDITWFFISKFLKSSWSTRSTWRKPLVGLKSSSKDFTGEEAVSLPDVSARDQQRSDDDTKDSCLIGNRPRNTTIEKCSKKHITARKENLTCPTFFFSAWHITVLTAGACIRKELVIAFTLSNWKVVLGSRNQCMLNWDTMATHLLSRTLLLLSVLIFPEISSSLYKLFSVIVLFHCLLRRTHFRLCVIDRCDVIDDTLSW